VFYTGGGVINAGPHASALLREFARLTGYPVTSTLMGLGAFPAADKQWLGMLGMHGTYEANLAMHDCDVMINIGARFDDRITGNVSTASRRARRRSTSTSIRPRSTRTVKVDIGIVGDCAHVLEDMVRIWREDEPSEVDKTALKAWWTQIDGWRARNSLAYKRSDTRSSSRNMRWSGSML
jgi:acetolactate synthase-1/2/3 large subunit